MTRDYKHAGTRRQAPARTPGWVWLLTGLVIGLGVAAGGYFYFTGGKLPPAADSSKKPHAAAPPPPAQAPEPPSKPAQNFDFYTLLPEMEILVPDEPRPQPEKNAGSASPAPTTPSPQGTYMVQVGAFRDLREADGLKASLALIGIEASIQPINIQGRERWYRVRVGHIPTQDGADRIRRKLRQNNLNSIVVKLND